MATRPTLPYFAPPDRLPAPLPTVAEIMAVTPSSELFPRKHPVVRVGEHFMVKYGPGVRLQEGENMLFVQQSSNVPVPTLYALFHDEETGNNFIVQEYIPGQDMFRYWDTLDQAGKEAVASQLRRHLDELRSIPSPGYYGGVWRQPIMDFYLTGGMDVGPRPDTPACDTEEEWVEAMLTMGQDIYAVEPPMRYEWLKTMYHSGLRGHEPVFTHGDLDRGNILVRDDGTLVLIDWEYAGWYPSYWEFSNMSIVVSHRDDWCLWLSRFLQEYALEAGWMFHFRSWIMWGGSGLGDS